MAGDDSIVLYIKELLHHKWDEAIGLTRHEKCRSDGYSVCELT